MTVWSDIQDSLRGSFRHGDGLAWTFNGTGIPLGDMPTSPTSVMSAAAIFASYGTQIVSAATAFVVPVELLAAVIGTETGVGPDPAFLARLDGYLDDNQTPELVRAGCCGMFLSIARDLAMAPLTTSNLFDPGTALSYAAQHIAAIAGITSLQPPLVASAFNVGNVFYDAASDWRLASYDGSPTRITRFVEWFNAAVMACEADITLFGTAPSYAAVLPSLQPSPPQNPLAPPTQLAKPESQAALDAGMLGISDAFPSTAAVWSLDDTTLAQIGAVARDDAAGLGLPGGFPVFAYPDKSRTQHVMTGPAVQALYVAMRNYVAAIWAYDTDRAGGLPGQPVLI